ncbi:MAG TPA: hypothetical protein VFQ31_03125 [Methyloceanibacter sp.]|nr:hypothetical protein [Methyloceanibacter sp.]
MAETWSVQELLSAGWSEADLSWEHAAERTADAAALKDYARAKDEAGRALRIARAEFEAIDPRLGTSLANYGVCLHLSGESGGIAPLFRQAAEVWRGAGPWIARMDAPRVARSSLFHMRMEVRHRETYRARWQERWKEIATEARSRLVAMATPPDALDTTAAESLARWRRERPAMLNDTRKLMAAGFLLLAPSPRASA